MRQGWETKNIEEIFDLQMGKTPDRDNSSFWGGDNIWISISDLDYNSKYVSTSKEKITNSAIKESGIKCVKKGTVIMSFKLSIGKVAIADTDLYTNEAIMSFKIKDGYNIYAPYIYYYLKGYKWNGANKAVMGLTLNKRAIAINKFCFPNISIQESIANELDCLSIIIDKKKKQLEELDKLAQAIFYDMFGDPITNEKGWEMKNLEGICDISSSKRIFANEYTETGIPFYRGKEITEKSKGSEISVELYISHERYNEIKENYGVPQIGDILLTAVGTIGNMWVVNSNEPFYFKDGNILWLKLKKQYNPIFFKELLNILISKHKAQMANGCAYNALTIVNLKKMPTSIVPFEMQQQFSEKIESIEKQKALIKKSLEEVETLFNSRMDYYFN